LEADRDAEKADAARTFVCEVAARLPSGAIWNALRPAWLRITCWRGGERRLQLCMCERGRFPVLAEDFVNIRFISSMTNDDENRFASALLNAMDELLRHLPIVYYVRIDTTAGGVLQRSRAVTVAPSESVERKVV
jgi:hypothetical protein